MKYRFLFLVFAVAISMTACQKDDYKNDGGVSDPHVNMTTYDFLKSQPVFDSLVKVIDRAGLKEMVNGNITFFATTNYGVADFIAARKERQAVILNDENISYTIDSVPLQELKDSMKIYMFEGEINRDQMTTSGKLYNSLLGDIPNVQFLIKLRRTQDYSAYADHVDYVNFTKVIGTRDDQELDPDNIPKSEVDQAYDCQTSGIITTTGIVHVLSGNHRLFFNQE